MNDILMAPRYITTYAGQPLEDMTREQLIEALRRTSAELRSVREAIPATWDEDPNRVSWSGGVPL